MEVLGRSNQVPDCYDLRVPELFMETVCHHNPRRGLNGFDPRVRGRQTVATFPHVNSTESDSSSRPFKTNREIQIYALLRGHNQCTRDWIGVAADCGLHEARRIRI